MASVPNQKQIVSAPRLKKDKDHLYAKLNLDALQQAMKDLNGSGLKLYLYFAKNREDYNFDLSQKACEEWGLSRSSYYRGVKELKEAGYLVEKGSTMTYYELPQVHTYNKEELPSVREAAIGDNVRWLEDDVVELGDGKVYKVLPF